MRRWRGRVYRACGVTRKHGWSVARACVMRARCARMMLMSFPRLVGGARAICGCAGRSAARCRAAWPGAADGAPLPALVTAAAQKALRRRRVARGGGLRGAPQQQGCVRAACRVAAAATCHASAGLVALPCAAARGCTQEGCHTLHRSRNRRMSRHACGPRTHAHTPPPTLSCPVATVTSLYSNPNKTVVLFFSNQPIRRAPVVL
jgi:hypothetical protein